MTEKEKRMRAYSQNRFAALETALYLDTHPTDRKALAAFRTYAEEAEKQRAEYEKKRAARQSAADAYQRKKSKLEKELNDLENNLKNLEVQLKSNPMNNRIKICIGTNLSIKIYEI